MFVFQRDRRGPEGFRRLGQTVGAQKLPGGGSGQRIGRVPIDPGRGRPEQMPRHRSRPGRATRLVPGAPVARLRVQVRGNRVPAPKRPLGVLAHVGFLQQKVSDVEKAYFVVRYTNWTI